MSLSDVLQYRRVRLMSATVGPAQYRRPSNIAQRETVSASVLTRPIAPAPVFSLTVFESAAGLGQSFVCGDDQVPQGRVSRLAPYRASRCKLHGRL